MQERLDKALPATPGERRCSRGFSLIEVLIAMIVLSVGMLGIAGMYLQTLQAGRTSQFRTQAVTVAADVADRIRANPTGGAAYTGAGADNNCIDGGIDCTPAQMAQQDVLGWTQRVQQILPAGNVVVAFNNATVPPTYSITVSWQEAGLTAAPSYQLVIQVD